MGKCFKSVVEDADIIHFFGNGPEMLGFAANSVARELQAKFVVEPALHKGQWGDSWIDKELYTEADLLLAHTQFEASVLAQMGLKEAKVKVITHGVDAAGQGDEKSFRALHRISGPIVLFLGRKTKEKGILNLMEAWALVLANHPNATLVLAGSGLARDLHELPPSTLDLDHLTEKSKQDALAACQVLCVPSEGESFGMVYFEAWAYKKPVVALDLPVLQETIGASRGGILVKPTPNSIASAINTLLMDSKASASMGEAGELFARRHDWAKAVESYLQAYGSIY
jgi:glycosyltransferase involved in cell wall biosynthesis